jgi:hypothetical protein
MRLMAALAHLVTWWRSRELLLVARPAGGRLLAVVGVVAADALGMGGHDASLLGGVARAALGDG